MSDLLETAQGSFSLIRCPENKKQGLRAWNAADEYLLNEVSEYSATKQVKNILVINDAFGGLTVPLAESFNVDLWSDSFVAQQCIEVNFQRNKLHSAQYRFIKSTDEPEGQYDLVLLKIPKNYFYLEEQLAFLSRSVAESTKLFAATMVKNLHTSTLKIFEKYFVNVTTSLAKKKARLVYFSNPLTGIDNVVFKNQFQLEDYPCTIENLSNVFSRERLDVGTRFFLQYLPEELKGETVIDLGCGNGVVGLIAAEKYPEAKIIFCDESYMAVEAARRTFERSGFNNSTEYFVTNGLQGIKDASADLILNNPPFHQQHVVGTEIALVMFKDAKRVLKKGGELRIVGNRHLGYHISLKKIFGNCELVAGNNKFVVLKAVK